MSVPLNSLLNGNNLFLTTNTITNNGQVQQQVGLNGSSQDGEFNYAVAQGWQNQTEESQVTLTLTIVDLMHK